MSHNNELSDKIYEALKSYRCLYFDADDSKASLLDVLSMDSGMMTIDMADEELSELAAHIADELVDEAVKK